jgi:sec-independent protein translocase protein TatC
MTFLEHLDDLRKRLFHSFLAIVFTIFPAWFFHEQIFDILAKPINQYLPEGETLVVTRLPEAFIVYIKVSFLAAIFVASPYIFFQFWKFVAPGLFQREKKYVIPFIFFTTIFFAAGGAFGYFVVFPFAVRFFINMSAKFELVIKADEYLSLALHVLLGIALVFELPTLVFFLSRMGLITAKWMAKKFKYAVLVVFIIAAIITPTPDPLIQSIVAIPMLALYGFGILIAFLSEKKRKEKAKESNSEDDLAG